MITLAEVEKLGRIHAVEPVVLSVYLNVPRSPAELSGLPARVDELVVAAERDPGRSGYLRAEDRRSARDEAALAGPGWFGHPLAIFACAEVRAVGRDLDGPWSWIRWPGQLAYAVEPEIAVSGYTAP